MKRKELLQQVFEEQSELIKIEEENEQMSLNQLLNYIENNQKILMNPFQDKVNLIFKLIKIFGESDELYEIIEFLYLDGITTLTQLLQLDQQTIENYGIPYDQLKQDSHKTDLQQYLQKWNISTNEQLEFLNRKQIINLEQFFQLSRKDIQDLKMDPKVYLQTKKEYTQQQQIIQQTQKDQNCKDEQIDVSIYEIQLPKENAKRNYPNDELTQIEPQIQKQQQQYPQQQQQSQQEINYEIMNIIFTKRPPQYILQLNKQSIELDELITLILLSNEIILDQSQKDKLQLVQRLNLFIEVNQLIKSLTCLFELGVTNFSILLEMEDQDLQYCSINRELFDLIFFNEDLEQDIIKMRNQKYVQKDLIALLQQGITTRDAFYNDFFNPEYIRLPKYAYQREQKKYLLEKYQKLPQEEMLNQELLNMLETLIEKDQILFLQIKLAKRKIINLSTFFSLSLDEAMELKLPKYKFKQMKEKYQQDADQQKLIKQNIINQDDQTILKENQLQQYAIQEENELKKLINKSKIIKQINDLTIYQYPIYISSDIKIEQGIKTMIVLGQTGSGKTTLLNFFLNYYLGVKFEDNFRFKLIQEDLNSGTQSVSQTQEVKIYYVKPIDNSPALRIIDTPGFGDTKGISQDKTIITQIENCFRKQVDSLTTICFAMQASNVRLTANQNYILSCMTQLFGKDVIENFIFMFTFCDGGQPQAKEALKFKGNKEHQGSHVAAYIDQIQEPWYLQFNSSAYLSTNQGSETELYMTKMFWEMGMKSFNQFVTKKLKRIQDVSLTLTQDVIKYREQLMNCITVLRPKTQQLLTLIESQNQVKEVIENLKCSLIDSQHYTVLTTKFKMKKINLNQGEYVTNCIICNHTCHYPCIIPNNENKQNCSAMRDGRCMICQSKCSWEQHQNAQFRIVAQEYQEEVVLKDLKQKYQQASSTKSSKEQILEGIEKEILEQESQCLENQVLLKDYINILNDTALQPAVCKSQSDYVDIMIQEEESRKDAGYLKRIKVLQEQKETWKFMQDTYNADFKYTKDEIKSILQKKKQGIAQKIWDWFS